MNTRDPAASESRPPEDRLVRLVARNFFQLGAGEAVARLIAFAAALYVARTLGVVSYGIVGLAAAIYLYLARIADGGIELGLGVREIAADRSAIRTLAPSIMTARLLLAVALSVLVIALALTLVPGPEGDVIAVTALLLITVGGGTRWIFLGLERTRWIALVRTLGELVSCLFILLLVHDGGDVARVPLSQLIGEGTATLVLLLGLRRFTGRSLPVELDLDKVRPLMRRALPLIASGLLGLILYNSDLIFLRFFSGAKAVGLYVAAYTLVSFLINLGTAYNQSLLPTLTRAPDGSAGEQQLYGTAIVQVFALTLPAAVGGFLVAPNLVGLAFGPAYAESGAALAWLMWSVPLLLVRGVPNVALLARGKEDRVMRINLIATGFNLALNLLLIPVFGILGAAWSTVGTELIRLLVAHLYAAKEGFRMPRTVRLMRVVAATSFMWAVLAWFAPASLPVAVSAGMALYLLGLVLCGGARLTNGAPSLRL